MIGATLAHFRIAAKLGEGGMGQVYRAEDTKLGREVAIKVLPEAFVADTERLARFEREARLLASLNHANIAGLHEIGEAAPEGAEGGDTAPRHYLVMELAHGETLADRIGRGPIPVDEALPIAVQIAEALEAAHGQGIVHRDLKPGNVMVDAGGRVKVLDFGLAKAWEPAGADTGPMMTASPTLSAQMTGAGVLLGTAAYMSPEQARGQAADRRADVWAFGVVLYEMLLGGRLFTGETVSDTLAAVLRADPDWEHLPKDLPRPVSRLLRRALERDPRRRLRDAGDARLELEAALRGEEADVGGPGAGADTAAAPVRVRPWRVATVVLLLATLGLGTRVVLDRLATPKVVRSRILAPPDTRLYLAPGRPGPATLSRDGRQIAFTAATADGSPSLWVRPVDSLLARELPGTQEAQYPFWSPDGRYVGFFTRGSLKKIAVAGGPPVTLCDCAPNGKGGTWSPEGLIVFAPGVGSGLWVVSAAGGEPRELTTLDEKTENSHRHPRFLPDGRHFLFLARRNSQGNELRVGSTDGDAPRGLLETPANAEYARGRLLFLRDTTLMAQPFDADRAELGGEAIPLVENVLHLSGAALAVFSSSAEGSLIYQEGTGTASTRLVWRGRDGEELGTLGDEPADERQPALSPDGRLVAVGASDPDTGTDDIWIYDVERNLRTRLTFDAADDFAPRFSPDGRTIVFSSERDGQSATLWTVPVAGTGQPGRLAAADGRTLVATSWSPDGEWIVATAVGGSTAELDIMVVPAQGGGPEPLIATQFSEAPASVSPDGRWVAYRSDETGRNEVYVTSFPKPGRKWQVSRGEGHMPAWRGDGREIYYRDARTLYAAVVDGTGETFVPGEVTALFDLPPRFTNGRQYEPSRDGQRFLVVEPLQATDASPITLVLNWDAELER